MSVKQKFKSITVVRTAVYEPQEIIHEHKQYADWEYRRVYMQCYRCKEPFVKGQELAIIRFKNNCIKSKYICEKCATDLEEVTDECENQHA